MTQGSVANDCMRQTAVTSNGEVSITRQPGAALRKLYLGFNLEAIPFERSYLNADAKAVTPELLARIKGLPGSVLRYPGGTVANRIDLLAAKGESRPKQNLMSWFPAQPVSFGPGEYANFVKSAGARGWLIVNILGDESDWHDAKMLAANNARLVKELSQETSLLRIELGNELYMPNRGMSGTQYAERLLPTLAALKGALPAQRVVVGLAGFDVGRTKAAAFNAGVLEGLAGADVDFSLHYYYDGHPGGPPITRALRNLCDTIDDLTKKRGKAPAIWITEHARWPGGRTVDPDWKKLWFNTYTLGAALSEAEFSISVAMVPQVQGLFLHALAGSKGPWPMFHSQDNGHSLVPSATFLAQSIMQPLAIEEVLPTAVSAPSADGVPIVRAAITRADDAHWSVLAIHRGEQPRVAVLTIPELSGKTASYEMDVLTGPDADAYNSTETPTRVHIQRETGRLDFSTKGVTTLTLPPRSVNRLALSAAGI